MGYRGICMSEKLSVYEVNGVLRGYFAKPLKFDCRLTPKYELYLNAEVITTSASNVYSLILDKFKRQLT